MEEGLNVGIDQFKKMSSKDRDAVMFTNMVHLRGKIKNDQLNKKIQYIWLFILTGVLGLKNMLGI